MKVWKSLVERFRNRDRQHGEGNGSKVLRLEPLEERQMLSATAGNSPSLNPIMTADPVVTGDGNAVFSHTALDVEVIGAAETPRGDDIWISGDLELTDSATTSAMEYLASDSAAPSGGAAFAASASSGPNLQFDSFVNWNDRIPIDVQRNSGTADHTYDGPYYDDQRLYFNHLVHNSGDSASGQYYTRWEIGLPSGGRLTSNTRFPATPAGGLLYYTNDITPFISSLPAGANTFRVWVDLNDEVDEVSEFDNYYDRTITVLPAGSPSAEEVTAEPFGVSDGVSAVRVDGEIDEFGAEKAYSVNLVAGQLISAQVQTPHSDGVGFVMSPGLTIPDDGSTVTSTMTLPIDLTIKDVDVVVNLEHRNLEDIDLRLIPPSGAPIELSTDNGGTQNNYYNTIFDDEGPVSIDSSAAEAPFAWRHAPEEPLSVLDGTSTKGQWQLQIIDDSSGSAAPGILHSWSLRFNRGLNTSLTITGPNGELASNENIPTQGAVDPAIDNVVVPVTGTYEFRIGNSDKNIGTYVFEVGIVESTVPAESGETTDLDPLASPNGNIVVRGTGDGIGESDQYTVTLAAGQAVTIGTSTPGGLYAPRLQVGGPGGFSTSDFGSGPANDSVVKFIAAEAGTYSITVDYPSSRDYADAVSSGTYVLSVVTTDMEVNNSIADSRPISTVDYRDPVAVTSSLTGISGVEGLWEGGISSATDTDYFHLGQLSAGTYFRVTTKRDAGSSLYSRLYLGNSAGEVLRVGNTVRSGPDAGAASIEGAISAEDDYYLVVLPDTTEANGETVSTGDYKLFYAVFDTNEDPYEDNDSQAEVDALVAGNPEFGESRPGGRCDGDPRSGNDRGFGGLVPVRNPGYWEA